MPSYGVLIHGEPEALEAAERELNKSKAPLTTYFGDVSREAARVYVRVAEARSAEEAEGQVTNRLPGSFSYRLDVSELTADETI